MTVRAMLSLWLLLPSASAALSASPHLLPHRSVARMVATAPSLTSDDSTAVTPLLSGLEGKALLVEPEDVPSKSAVRAVVPDHCFKRSTARSLGYVAQSLACTAATAAIGLLIPLRAAALPLWIAYAMVTGTAAMGLWVLAHECGHGAFSDNRLLQDTVGYALHSLLLVPYFSWQRSHSVHHAHTNHILKGETHVPTVVDGRYGHETPGGEDQMDIAKRLGEFWHGCYQLFGHLTIGWPSYLLAGLTGGSAYGTSNHFWPRAPFSDKLWPGKWAVKVLQSAAGVGGVLALLALWAQRCGAATVWAFYGGPYLVVNAWLIVYTWLQHTDVDVPHLGSADFTYMRGAFLTIDRPYPKLIDWLHHRIGTTHVAHHIDCTIPHYHAREATDAIKEAFPKAYLYEPTPVHKALWRVARHCIAVQRRSPTDSRFVFVPLESWKGAKER